jgi:hypothetical protein
MRRVLVRRRVLVGRWVLVELLLIAAILGGGFLAGVLVERRRVRPPLDAEQSALAEQVRTHRFFQTPPTAESLRHLADQMIAAVFVY